MEKKKKNTLLTQYFKKTSDLTQTTQSESKEESKDTQDCKKDNDALIDKDEFAKNFNDGKRVYHNKLEYYEHSRPDMISFQDLFLESAGIQDNKENEPNCRPQNIVFTSFVVEDTFLAKHIVSKDIEFTVFKHGYLTYPCSSGKCVVDYPDIKMRLVLPDLRQQYCVFHPKVILIKFEAFLRVVITTANLLERDWEQLGQLVWFQDFPYTAEPIKNTFKEDLKKFFEEIIPTDTTVSVKKSPEVFSDYKKIERRY